MINDLLLVWERNIDGSYTIKRLLIRVILHDVWLYNTAEYKESINANRIVGAVYAACVNPTIQMSDEQTYSVLSVLLLLAKSGEQLNSKSKTTLFRTKCFPHMDFFLKMH